MTATDTFRVVIASRVDETRDIAALTVRAVKGGQLPSWSAGDHIDVETPAGTRQYSLCGPRGADAWTIAVLHEPDGRGGSRWLWETGVPGVELVVGHPRSTFHQKPCARSVFIAGGIGITPIAAMIDAAESAGTPWSLLYTVRAEGGHAFASRYAGDERATLWTSAIDGRYDIASFIAGLPASTSIACCGPAELIDAVLAAAEASGRKSDVSVEHFQAVHVEADGPEHGFVLELAKSGVNVQVPADTSALDALAEAGQFIPSSCREGICGSCETAVLDGVVDHRDSLLDEDERAENSCFFPCVSRARAGRLLIDL